MTVRRSEVRNYQTVKVDSPLLAAFKTACNDYCGRAVRQALEDDSKPYKAALDGMIDEALATLVSDRSELVEKIRLGVANSFRTYFDEIYGRR